MELPESKSTKPLLNVGPSLVLAVAAVNDDVPLLQERHQLVDEVVDGLARLDQHHDPETAVFPGAKFTLIDQYELKYRVTILVNSKHQNKSSVLVCGPY